MKNGESFTAGDPRFLKNGLSACASGLAACCPAGDASCLPSGEFLASGLLRNAGDAACWLCGELACLPWAGLANF